MKKITKILALILAFALVLAACQSKPADSGSSGSQDNSSSSTTPPPSTDTTPTPAPEDNTLTGPAEPDTSPITLKVMQWKLDNQETDFENLWYYQELEAKTGVTVDWRIVREADWNQQINLTFASGEYPDVIVRPNAYLNIEDYGVDQGILIPLDDYLEENMPNYYPRLAMNNVSESMVSSDGKMYYIGWITAQNINHNANFFINKTWLDTLSRDVPKTVDELTDTLRAFRDENPGGVDSVLPMSAGDLIHQTQGLYTHFAMFGVPLQRWIYAAIDDNDKVVFPGYMEGFREACEWLNLCYTEGLLDKDSITQDDNAWGVKMNDGRVGFTTYLRLINTALKNPETTENWISIVPPQAPNGATVPRILEIPEFGAVLTVSNKNVPRTLQWLDAQLETEFMLMSVNGPTTEGPQTAGLVDPAEPPVHSGEPTLIFNDATGKYEVVYVPKDNGLYTVVPVTQGQFFAPGDYYFDIFDLPPHRIERAASSREYEQAGVLEKNSYMILEKLLKLTSEEATEQQYRFDTIDMLMQETITTFITGGVTDESWDNFLNQTKAAGVDDYIATFQKGYDAYLAASR